MLTLNIHFSFINATPLINSMIYKFSASNPLISSFSSLFSHSNLKASLNKAWFYLFSLLNSESMSSNWDHLEAFKFFAVLGGACLV